MAYVVLGVLVGIIVAVIFPWLLLRKIEQAGEGSEQTQLLAQKRIDETEKPETIRANPDD